MEKIIDWVLQPLQALLNIYPNDDEIVTEHDVYDIHDSTFEPGGNEIMRLLFIIVILTLTLYLTLTL